MVKLKFIKGNARYSFLNGILNCNDLELGSFGIDWTRNKNGNITNKKKCIKIVKQDKWYLHIPIIFHEFGHYLVDLIFPMDNNGKFHPKHELVEKYINMNKIYKIL